MEATVTGQVFEKASGTALSTPKLALHKLGAVGELATVVDQNGRFSFSSLEAGEYSLSAYDDNFVFWHQRLSLNYGQNLSGVHVALSRGGRIAGRLLDEFGRPPRQGLLTLLRQGERNGRFGIINVSGDHKAAEDGRFQTPPLASGADLLRFAGILEPPPSLDTAPQNGGLTPDRIFDFLYPNAHDITCAVSVAVEEGQTISDIEVRILRPTRYRVEGRVVGVLPSERDYISIQFRRDFGTLDQVGWAGGAAIQPDGKFEGLEQPGRYTAEVCQLAPPELSGRTYLIQSFGSTTFTVGSEDLFGVEIQVGSNVQEVGPG
jgi:hypothetical protein